MTYKEFRQTVERNGWTLEQVRFDVPPTSELMTFLEDVGPDYERFALRYQSCIESK